jgi:hypothetical protein
MGKLNPVASGQEAGGGQQEIVGAVGSGQESGDRRHLVAADHCPLPLFL